jgi:hypothetical protein
MTCRINNPRQGQSTATVHQPVQDYNSTSTTTTTLHAAPTSRLRVSYTYISPKSVVPSVKKVGPMPATVHGFSSPHSYDARCTQSQPSSGRHDATQLSRARAPTVTSTAACSSTPGRDYCVPFRKLPSGYGQIGGLLSAAAGDTCFAGYHRSSRLT